ncbi:MAG TPA: hypothetical protein VN765_11290 [Candidatus Acidoferrum sp.]|nr:hypothetical protein [Candidatus Acidoferrum sp.]
MNSALMKLEFRDPETPPLRSSQHLEKKRTKGLILGSGAASFWARTVRNRSSLCSLGKCNGNVLMISSELIKSVLKYLSAIGSSLFPGLFILDKVLHRGLFSGSVQTIYDFILLIVWAVGLSFFYSLLPAIIFNLDPMTHKAMMDEKKGEDIEAEICNLIFPLAMCFAVFHFVAYKITIAAWPTLPSEWLGMTKHFCFFILSMFLTLLLQYPVSKMFLEAFKLAVKKSLCEHKPDA